MQTWANHLKAASRVAFIVTCQVLLARAADTVVGRGGSDGWVEGVPYNPLQAQLGDVLVSNNTLVLKLTRSTAASFMLVQGPSRHPCIEAAMYCHIIIATICHS